MSAGKSRSLTWRCGTPCSAGTCSLPRPGRRGAGTMGAAGRLPGAADGHDRCRRVRRSRPGPGQLHHRAGGRPRPGHRARGVADSETRRTGRIGRAVLDGLLPARRPRYSARKVKCSTSRYHVRDAKRGQDRPCQSVTITRVQITIRFPPADRPAARPRRANQTPGPRPLCPGTARPGHPHHGQPARPGLVRQRTQAARRKNLRTCSPSSPSGPASASSPKPAAARTPSGPAAPDGTATDSAGP